MLGPEYMNRGDQDKARALLEQAVRIGSSGQFPLVELAACSVLSITVSRDGQPQRALELADRSLVLSRRIGDRAREAQSHLMRSNILLATQRFNEAESSAMEAIGLYKPTGDARLGDAITIAALAATRGRNPQRACRLLREA